MHSPAYLGGSKGKGEFFSQDNPRLTHMWSNSVQAWRQLSVRLNIVGGSREQGQGHVFPS